MDGMYGAAKGPRRYSGAVGTIELDDFIQEFDTWCDMQFLRNPTLFTPFFAWKGLFQHLEGPPMDDYHEFGREYAAEIDAWRRHWSPNYSSITQGGVGTSGGASIGISGGASSSISEGTSGAVGATGTSTSSGTVSIAGGSTRGDASGVPSFSPIPEFFQRLRKNYQGVKTETLRSLQEFERKTGESLREAYTRMRRLISVTHGVTEAHAVQYWYRILDRELRRKVRDATLMSDSSPTLAHVFALSEKIELNMVEERVMTSTFARDTTTTSRIPHSPAQSRPISGSRGGHTRHPSCHREHSARPPLPSFSGHPQGPSCWTCGGSHMRKDCPQERQGQTPHARPQPAQVTCDHCHRPSHPRERCFDLHPELRSGGRGRGGDAPRGRGGRGIGAIERTAASATSATESAMAARIEQLEQRLATMAGLGASTSTSYEGEDFSYLASAAHVEASVAVTRGGARTSEPRGANVELDPQRGEGGRQSRLPQSFLLSEVGSSSSMRPAPPTDTRVRTEVLTSSVVDAYVPSSAVMRMATSVLRSPLFSATELIDSGIDLARVFRVAATSCEHGRVAATSAEIREDTVEDPSSTSTLFEEMTWQAAEARMESLPARPAIDRESIVPGVCMVDNRSGLFRLVSSTGQIQTSLGGASNRSYCMTRESIAVQLRHDHPHDSSQFGVRAVVTSAESYDVLVGGVVLYPMGFRMDYWTETAAYRPGWQFGDGRMSELPVRFISRDRSLGSSSAVLASVAGFSGVLTWPDDLLEGNMSADVTLVYEDVEEVVSFTAAVTSPLDVPLWSSCQALQLEADRLVKKAWSEASLPAEPDRASADRLVSGSSALSPLITTHIAWEYSSEGVCLLDLFGGISTGLAVVLQSGILVRRYLYVEKDETARRVSSRHVAQLMRRFPSLLPRSAVRGFQKALPSDISLLGALDLDRVGHIDMVIAGWPCQGHTRAGHGTRLHDPRSRMFWEMMRVLRHLQVQQTRSPAYILENVPLLGDTRAQLMASVHQVRAWIGSVVLLDAAKVGSRAHHARLWWTNLLPREILRHAYDSVQHDSTLTVDSILDVSRHSQVVRVADRSPMALVNRVGQPRMALPTFVNYPASHAYRDGGPGLLWDSTLHQLVEPNADERERAMGFFTGVTAASSVSEASRRQVLDQAMDLNCLTWIVSLGLAEQGRLRADLVVVTPLISSLPTGTVVAMAGGDRRDIRHPWSLWDVTKGLARVAAHAVGEDSQVEAATKEGTENPSLQCVA
ncbi:hypothetical protein Mp_8g17980 [Marchantia polymorpha subsp. ruderalis]|uniref:DNA (cytosine-5-)-methyltransferase n=1 Tax=Marchantia polymorpha TaxID=3197 RepID=A0A2R6WVF0_MARPO|nr:hypothetical protein MARPO_0055s0073 [Marchantia polymorpha]PTQ42412.1 hypothetical protein MARPO_0030s0132 [Marchantia polymorpha]BBN20292.1 hypothetical protein Mp_8g17980 [Marchantia polymorpha subsp. ruderalis]|eukprot:PTQ37810.1 hypothetical protein MARPO_0055s0073 [Marchantia polymorpha]